MSSTKTEYKSDDFVICLSCLLFLGDVENNTSEAAKQLSKVSATDVGGFVFSAVVSCLPRIEPSLFLRKSWFSSIWSSTFSTLKSTTLKSETLNTSRPI